ncbi:MAG: peptidoglycan recognition family protein [Bacteroidota bacterium]
MSFTEKYTITPKYLPVRTKRRSGIAISPAVKFIVAHDTGNKNSTAAGNVKYYTNSANTESASAHLFVDDKEILECIPALTAAPEKAWHVLYNVTTDNQLYGYNANDAAIGVEYCFGNNINADEAYKKYIWVIAYLCYTFKLDPATSIVGHFFLDPKRKTDPVTGLAQSRRTYEQLLKDIVTEYNECTGVIPDPHQSTPSVGSATVLTKVNIRQGAPNTRANIVQTISAGTVLNYVEIVENGESINGNSKWYKDTQGNFFWSGAVKQNTPG